MGRRILAHLLHEDFTVLSVTRRGCYEMHGSDFKELDGRDLEDKHQTLQAVVRFQPDAVIHSAAYYGGIGICKSDPIGLFVRNTRMAAILSSGTASGSASRTVKSASFPASIVPFVVSSNCA